MTGLRQSPTDGREYGRVLLQEFTEENNVSPTSVTNPSLSTGSLSVRAPKTNFEVVYVGFDDDLTTDNGFPLYPGDALGLDLNLRSQEIFVIAEEDGDEVRYIVTN